MLKKIFKNIRLNLQDITEEELIDINNNNILKSELEHINKLLQEKEKVNGNLLLLIISGIGFLSYTILENIHSLLELKDNNIIIGYGLTVISISIFIFIISSQLPEIINRNELINRKKLILDLIKKNENLSLTIQEE